LNKSIASQTSTSSMSDHQRMLNRAQAKRKAAALLRKKNNQADYNIPGGQGTKGFVPSKWREQ